MNPVELSVHDTDLHETDSAFLAFVAKSARRLILSQIRIVDTLAKVVTPTEMPILNHLEIHTSSMRQLHQPLVTLDLRSLKTLKVSIGDTDEELGEEDELVDGTMKSIFQLLDKLHITFPMSRSQFALRLLEVCAARRTSMEAQGPWKLIREQPNFAATVEYMRLGYAHEAPSQWSQSVDCEEEVPANESCLRSCWTARL